MNLTAIAFILIGLLIAASFVKKLPTPFVLAIVPLVCGMLAGFSPTEVGNMALDSIANTMKSAGLMMLFGIIFFTTLTKTGMFNRLIGSIFKLFKGNVHMYTIMIMTVVLSAICMMTANIATSYLIVFPVMLPLYKKMNFNRASAMIIATTGIAAMCFLPWCGPVINSSVFAGVEATELSRALIPVSFCFIPVIILQIIYFGMEHKKSGAPVMIHWDANEAEAGQDGEAGEFARPKLYWFNLLVFAAVLVLLVMALIPTYLVFLFGSFILLMVNYPDGKQYQKIINETGKRYYGILIMLVGISTFLGVFQGTGMVGAVADFLGANIPDFLSRYIHLILAATMVVVIRYIPNKFYLSLYPVLIAIGANFGLTGPQIIAPFVLNMTLATGSSPMINTTHIGAGLMEIDMDDYCRKSFKVQGISNIIIVLIALLVGAVR